MNKSFSVLGSRFSVLGSRFSVLGSRFSVLLTLAACNVESDADDAAVDPREADYPAQEAVPFVHPGIAVGQLGLSAADAQGGDAVSSDVGVIVPPGWALEEGVQFLEGGETIQVSGPVPVTTRSLTSEEIEHLAAVKAEEAVARPAAVPERIGAPLAAWVGTAMPDETTRVLLGVRRAAGPGLQARFEMAVAAGEVSTNDAAEQLREQLHDEQRAAVAAAQEPVVDAIAAMGGENISMLENLHIVAADLTPAMIEELALRDDVVRMDMNSEIVPETITGIEVINGTQMTQFINAGNDGSWGNPNIRVAVIDAYFNDEHLGFRDGSGTATRIGGRYTCDADGCVSVANHVAPLSPPLTLEVATHGTIVAGLLFGDLRDAQDAGVPSPVDRIQRSGYAGEARGYLVRLLTNDAASFSQAMDQMLALGSAAPRVVNISLGLAADDPNCLGEDVVSRAVNELYSGGIVVVKSTGNNGHATATDCTVTSPGSALGALTVGGHGTSQDAGVADVRTGPIFTGSAQGGGALEGKGRTIIDLTAMAHRYNLFDLSGGYSLVASGTSWSAPTVAAGTVDFIDFFKVFNGGSAFIDQPGVVTVHMLLQGDRASTGARLTHGFSSLWGAGRLKMRMADAAGLDAPADWKTGAVCVGHGEVVHVNVNSGIALSANVNDFKAVAFWYDSSHEEGIDIDDIDLRLSTTAGVVLVESTSFSDEKERVYHSAIGGTAVRLDFVGSLVGADDTGCGANRMLVYYAYFYEDDARDDPEGPTVGSIDRE